jgi:hypothetical protein
MDTIPGSVTSGFPTTEPFDALGSGPSDQRPHTLSAPHTFTMLIAEACLISDLTCHGQLQDGEQRRGEGWDEKEPTGAPHPVAPNSGKD